MKFGTDTQHMCQISLLTFQRSRSKFKVKTAVLKIFHLYRVITWFFMFTKFGCLTDAILARNMTSDKIQDGGLAEVYPLWVVPVILLTFRQLLLSKTSEGRWRAAVYLYTSRLHFDFQSTLIVFSTACGISTLNTAWSRTTAAILTDSDANLTYSNIKQFKWMFLLYTGHRVFILCGPTDRRVVLIW